MKFIFQDYETYFDKDFTLRKMTPVEYVLDPRFQVIGCAIAEDDGDPFWLTGHDEVWPYLLSLDMENTVIVTHNALFDACINSWVFGVRPRLNIDTMAMARMLCLPFTRGVSLREISEYLGFPPKGTAIYNAMGHTAESMKQIGLWDEYVEYGKHDVWLCREIFRKLRPQFPATEILINDAVIRCATDPQFVLDDGALSQHLHEVVTAKQTMLDRAGLSSREDLMSNDRFAAALQTFGISPPRKISLRTGKETWAFAKTDQGMVDLETHPDPVVQALVAARIGVKTTLEETRTQKLINISRLQWPDKREKLMPVPLRYSGAHTHRLSGDWKLNLQNLPGGGNLRKALRAPEGYTVVSVDASQIEARLTAWLCGCGKLVTQFANGDDVYSLFATTIYGYPVSKKLPVERFLGKTSVLGLGFGMGPPKFETTVQIQARRFNIPIAMDLTMATKVVGLFRQEFPEIPAAWKHLDKVALPAMARGDEMDFGPCKIRYERIDLPNGTSLFYNKLRQIPDDDGRLQWVYTHAGKTKFIWGGTLLENIVQALDRVHVLEAMLRVQKRMPQFPMAHQVHDELIYVVPHKMVAIVEKIVVQEMSRRPSWALDLPLAAEAHHGASYGECK